MKKHETHQHTEMREAAMPAHGGGHTPKEENKHYRKLLIMALLSFIAMYVLMYSMVNTISNVYPNINQFYMAGLMASPMVVIEVLLMRSMYMNKKLNSIIIVICIVALIGFFMAIRQQTAVSDRQFLKSMIPHHSGAILMCNEANIKNPEIKKLCGAIRSSQQQEIAQMEVLLAQLKNK